MVPVVDPSTFAGAGAARRIRALRPPRPAVSTRAAHGWHWEEERAPDGRFVPTLVVFLAGGECRFTCVHCDLWRTTTPGPTPPGDLPRQLAAVLAAAGPIPEGAAIKLYNASNWFDARSVPPEDDAAIAARVAPFAEVVVECHPALLGDRAWRFAAALAGRLQVGIGFETVHPEALPRLNKGAGVRDLARGAAACRSRGIGVRAFVLVGAPWVPAPAAAGWAARTAAFAGACGVEHVSLVPLRAGNGAVDALAAAGAASLPTLADLEEALDRSLGVAPVVAADLWDLETHARCPACLPARRERLARIGRTGRTEPRVACPEACGS